MVDYGFGSELKNRLSRGSSHGILPADVFEGRETRVPPVIVTNLRERGGVGVGGEERRGGKEG